MDTIRSKGNHRSIIVSSLDDLPRAAREILRLSPVSKVFALYGEMGAGKTTLIKAICVELGVEDVVVSPTFTIINEYLDNQGVSIYHFDFYRIVDLVEVYNLGYEDYFYSGAYCFIEWPEKIEKLLPDGCTVVQITVESPSERSILVIKF